MPLHLSVRARLAILLAVLFAVTSGLGFAVADLALQQTPADPIVDSLTRIVVIPGSGIVGFQVVIGPATATATGPFGIATDDLTLLLAVGWVVLLPLLIVIAWRVAGRTIRPITLIAEVAGRAAPETAGLRVAVEGTDEIARLGTAVNGLLERFEQHEADRRRAVDEAIHEVRNPLAVLRTTLELALEDPADTGALRDAAEVSQRAGNRIARTVDDLHAQFRDAVPAVAHARVDLAAVAQELGRDYAIVAATHGLAMRGSGPSGLFVNADRDALKRAVENLLANAVRFAPPGSPIVLAAGAIPGWRWIGVRDFGPGIAADDQPLVFGRGWTGGRAAAGSGIGLAVVRQVAEAHGGTIRLTSAPGAGCSFVLWLPSADEPAPAGLSPADVPDPLWSPPLPGRTGEPVAVPAASRQVALPA